MQRFLYTSILLLVIFTQSSAQQKLHFSGYTKDLISAVHVADAGTSWDNLLHNRSQLVWNIDTAWTLRADLRTRLFIGDQSQSPVFDELIEAEANDVIDLSIGTHIGSKGYVHSYLDRLFVQYTKDKLEIRAGRQRINWGINTLWNPNDLFNAYAFTDFDYEERPGSDAISMRYYTGNLSSIEVVGKLGNDERDGVIAALWRTHAGKYDFQFLGGYLTNSEHVVIGGGWAGSIKNWGFKGEGSVFIPSAADESVAGSVSIGGDYVFASGLLIGVGGLYNTLGRTSGTLDDLFAFELSARNLYPFRWTLNTSAAWSFHPLVSGSMTAVYSIASSHPLFLSPAFTWSVKQNFDIDLVGQLVFNSASGRYRSPIQAGFLRVKWSY